MVCIYFTSYVCDMLFSQGPQVVSKGMVSFLLALGSLAPVTACSKKPVIKALALSFTARERKKGLIYMLALIPNLTTEDFFRADAVAFELHSRADTNEIHAPKPAVCNIFLTPIVLLRVETIGDGGAVVQE